MPNASSTNRIPASQPPVHRTAEQTTAASQPDGGALSPLIAACVSGFLFQFDLTALSAALPDIASSLSARVADQAWVIDVYSLALIFALPLAGPVADRYGRRRASMTGAILFALASVLCATATTLFSLLAWRVLQGIPALRLRPLRRHSSRPLIPVLAVPGRSAYGGQSSARRWWPGR